MASYSTQQALSLLKKGKKLQNFLLQVELKLLGRAANKFYDNFDPDEKLCQSILDKHCISSRHILGYQFSPSKKVHYLSIFALVVTLQSYNSF